MAAIAFDTLKFANKLKAVGVPDKQAEAEAEVLSEALEVNLKELVTNEALKRDLGDVELRLKHEIELVKLEMRDIERRMTIKLGTLMVLAIGVVATLVKLL